MPEGHDANPGAALPASASARRRRFWRRLALVAGPGLVAMLADTDAGSVITVAQSGAQWGYRLLLPNLVLIPFMFVAQELALRLALGTGQGIAELVLQRFGRAAAGLLLAALTVSCFGALVSELSGLAGAAQAFGVRPEVTIALTVGGLGLVLTSGSFRSIERIALLVGLFELAFLVMAWRAAPALGEVVAEAGQQPLGNSGYLTLLAANIGTGIIPWALLYQASASIDKGLGASQIGPARLETATGVVLCQIITLALLIAAAATLGGGGPLDSVVEIERTFTATLGAAIGSGVFMIGLAGSALVATVVVCLTLAWSFGEVLGLQHSLDHAPRQAPWFYGLVIGMLAAGGAVVVLGRNRVGLAIAAGVVNALLLPPLLFVLYRLARTALPPAVRLCGVRAALTGAALALAGGTALYAGLAGLF